PQAQAFQNLPENEHVTMRMAAACGLEVAPSALVPLRDGSPAFLTRRFDRADDGRKRRQEDFCQLAEKPPKEKYDGSAELCFRLVRRYAAEPGVAALRLFRQLLFCWWTGNGDAHLKNLSLLADDEGRYALSPAYDLLSTRLVIEDDPLALPVGGKRAGLTRRSWVELGASARLPNKVVEREIDALRRNLPACESLIERSFLTDAMKAAYRELLRERVLS
ncbi:MAG: type II toxin-antitoxin system HipA family toxin, partial [Planctomycetota bacterium JB042]